MIKETVSFLTIFNPVMFLLCTCLWAYIAYLIRKEKEPLEVRLTYLEHLVLYGDEPIFNTDRYGNPGKFSTKDLIRGKPND